MRTIKAQPNQSTIDLILMSTGSEEASSQWCRDNDMAESDVPVVGTVYLVSDAALALGDAEVVAYFRKNGVMRNGVLEPMKIGTLGAAYEPFAVVLGTEDGEALVTEDGEAIEVE